MSTFRDSRALPVPDGWAHHLEAWRVALVAAGRSPRTIRTRLEHLEHVARAMGGDVAGVSAARLIAWAGAQRWAAETRRSHYASLRGFFAWAHGVGVIAVNPAATLPHVAPGVPCPRAAPPLAISTALARADARGTLMVRLGLEAGLRRGEIAAVHGRDLVEDLAGWSLMVHGKGGKDRLLPLPADLGQSVRAATVNGFAFPGRDGGHLSPRRVGEILAELLPGQWTGHALRHAFAARVDEVTGGDLAVVQDLLGHASPVTTRIYVPRNLGRMRAAVVAASA